MQSSAPVLPELLAPAGDWEAMRAAVANGASAVYFGVGDFNARYRATNFSAEELPEIMRFLHAHQVLGYVTLNILIFPEELPEVVGMVRQMAAAQVDAVIVQDLGLARLIAQIVPSMAVHGSTQMTLTEPRAIEMVRRWGVRRVVLARELSLTDIRKITSGTDLPLEVFVHGALCVAYSGQCLTSEALGGRSANRGQCAQACRLPYDLIVDGQLKDTGDRSYLLSPQDLAAHDLIDQLADLGVASLKIEGRLKNAEYVAMTTQTYRAALDAVAAKEDFQLSPQQANDLAVTYSRGFSPGFLAGLDHQRLVPARFPKSRGVFVGKVTQTTRRGVLIQLDSLQQQLPIADVLKPGDGVVFDQGRPDEQEQGGRIYHVNPVGPTGAKQPLSYELVFAPRAIDRNRLESGALVWKTNDPALDKRLQQSYRDLTVEPAVSKQRVRFRVQGNIGTPLQISLAFADSASQASSAEVVATWPGPLQQAQKHPLTLQSATAQLERLGDSRFELAEVVLDVTDPVMVPKSVLNELRRDLVAQLEQLDATAAEYTPKHITSAEEFQTPQSQSPQAESPVFWEGRYEELSQAIHQQSRRAVAEQPQLYVMARSLAQVEAVVAWQPKLGTGEGLSRPAMVYCDFEDVRRYREAVQICRDADMPVGLATLRIIKPGEEGWLAHIHKAQADVVLVRNLTSISYFQQQSPETRLIGDYSLNVANELTADLIAGLGLERLVPSYDLNWEQFVALMQRSDPGLFEVVLHQHMPMFHMEHCVFAAMLSTGKDHRDCGRPCDRHRVELRNRVGSEFPLVADTGCRNTVFNSVAQSAAEFLPRMLKLGLRHFRIDLLREDREETMALVERYAKVLAGQESGADAWRQLQILNQLGVTRGTMQLG